MSESVNPSYEDIQSRAKGPGVEEWKRVDKARASLPEFYRELEADPRITDQARSERAWERYEAVNAEVEQAAPEARAKRARSAETAMRQSIPMPESEGLTTSNTEKQLLTQGEQGRIYRRLDRLENARGPVKRTPTQVLQEEFARGLEVGGAKGGAVCRAVYEIAQDTGADIDSIVEAHRKDSHRKAREDAQQAYMERELIGKTVSKPPFPRPEELQQGGKGVGTYRGQQKAFMPTSAGASTKLFQSRRRTHWR